MGACPAGGGHDGQQSSDFSLTSESNFLGGQTPGQKSWRYCSKCFGLFFPLVSAMGACPSGGAHTIHVGHDEALDVYFGDYALRVNEPSFPGQPGWRFCSKCLGLFFRARRSPEACPAGDTHNSSQSGDYSLANNVPTFPGQHGRRFCKKWTALFFGGRATPGICPAGGGHDPSQSGDYGIDLASNQPSGVKTAMFAFYLIRKPVSDGPIPYHGSFGGGTTGSSRIHCESGGQCVRPG